MGVKKITVRHKRNDCIGCGSCVFIAPENRIMDDTDGKATLKGAERKGEEFMVGQVDQDQLDVNKEAAAACPVNIIYVSDSEEGV